MNNTWKTLEFYCTMKKYKCKSIQEAILQNDNDTIKNVSKPNDLKGRPMLQVQCKLKFLYRKSS